MAEAAVLTSLGWLAAPSMRLLFDKASHYLGTGIGERWQILEATVLPNLSLAIEKAEESPHKGKVEIWLKRLKDAYYEAEDVIDLFEYEELEQKVKDDRKTVQLRMKNRAGTRLSSPSQFVPQRLKLASDKLNNALSVFSSKKIMLKNCLDKLIKIGMEADGFRDLLEAQKSYTWSDRDRDTISNPPALVFGREVDKETIVSWLTEKPLNSEPGPSRMQQPIPIIAIMGRSGIGKTALAQYVYDCMEKQKHFDQILWVHVPHKFEANVVIMNMIQIIKAEKGALHKCNYVSTTLESLKRERDFQMLQSKKILLVLDDIWCDDDSHDTEGFQKQWEMFINCLGPWSPESRILITTQSSAVASHAHVAKLTAVKTHILQYLEENQCLELLMHHAWPSDCSKQRDKFEKIGRKIAVKLKGDPGAAKVLGRQLMEKIDILHWEEIAEKDWDKDTMEARIWSYQRLPVHLQRCFTFCSLFPRGNRLPTPLLINLWIAEGLIELDKHDTLEGTCIKYVNELLSRFFLEINANNMEESIFLHDLFYDLAERVRGDEFITIDPANVRKILLHNKMDSIRHIYLPASMTKELKDRICLMKNLCTLCIEPDGIISMKVLQEILEHSKRLRVMYIPAGVDNLPDSIGNLKHLRYLNIRGSPFKKLPNSICKLYHLQNLIPPRCESLPKNFCELISLRHLLIDSEMGHTISNFGRLTSLQILGQIAIKKEAGPKLDQLENLNQLRGIISIVGLENVMDIDDVVRANMREKEHLEELQLEWNSNESVIDDFQLLDALQPHPNIKVLAITRYKGNRFPTWLLQHDSLIFLTTLRLVECTKVEVISSIDKSLPNCKFLTLRGLETLKELPALPPDLIALEIVGIPHLSFFTQDDLLVKRERKSLLEASKQIKEHLRLNHTQLPKEVRLDVRGFLQFVKRRLEAAREIRRTNIPYDQNIFSGIDGDDYSWDQLFRAWDMGMHCHLETMMNKNEESKLVLPSSLISLTIGSCNITSDALASCMQSLVFLSELKLSKIQSVTSLPPKEILCALKNLQSLTIEGCYFLCSLGGIEALTSLTELTLDKSLNLNASNEPLPLSLKKLVLRVCLNINAILAGSKLLPVLSVLDIMSTTNQQGVLDVGHLSSLENLTIVGWSGSLKGLNSLEKLHSLGFVNPFTENYFSSQVEKCTSEKLKMVGVNNPEQLTQMLSDNTIESIEALGITNFGGDSLEDEVFRSLTSLKSMMLNCCKITHLPPNMKILATLHFMEIEDCPNLRKLDNLPQNLLQLQITNCPTLEENFKKDGPNYRVRFQQGSTIVTFLT